MPKQLKLKTAITIRIQCNSRDGDILLIHRAGDRPIFDKEISLGLVTKSSQQRIRHILNFMQLDVSEEVEWYGAKNWPSQSFGELK